MVEVVRLGDLGHGAGGLPGGEDDEPAHRWFWKMSDETGRRMGRRDRDPIKLFQKRA
jgi:hypothetical protein